MLVRSETLPLGTAWRGNALAGGFTRAALSRRPCLDLLAPTVAIRGNRCDGVRVQTAHRGHTVRHRGTRVGFLPACEVTCSWQRLHGASRFSHGSHVVRQG